MFRFLLSEWTLERRARALIAFDRNTIVRISIALASTLPILGLLSNGSCTVTYTTCNCNPCDSNCTCNQNPCNPNPAVGFDDSHRLAVYELSIVPDGTGRSQRIFSAIVGLSLERALGPGEYGAHELAQFAQGVIHVNDDLLATPLGEHADWKLGEVELFEAAAVVSFHSESTPGISASSLDTMSFLFDRRGNLIEIDVLGPQS